MSNLNVRIRVGPLRTRRMEMGFSNINLNSSAAWQLLSMRMRIINSCTQLAPLTPHPFIGHKPVEI